MVFRLTFSLAFLFPSLIESEPAYIISCDRHNIGRLDLVNNNFSSLVSGQYDAVSLDFFYEGSWIFWTDVRKRQIFRGKVISYNLTQIEPIIHGDLELLEGIAVDWVGQNIYWVDSDKDQIEVAKLDGSHRSVLIAGNMTHPRAIALDPREGALFWTDWDLTFPRIETISMAGERRRTIFNLATIDGGGLVNGITIDYNLKRLYWVDARSDSIHSIDYNGQDHLLVLRYHSELKHPFAITLYENFVYLTDWKTASLLKVNQQLKRQLIDRRQPLQHYLKQKTTHGGFDQNMTNSTLKETLKSTSDDKDKKNIWLYVVIILVSVLVITVAIVIIRLRYRRRKSHGQMKLSWSRTQSK